MPIFEFRCDSCGLTFEKIARKPDPGQRCPDCGQPCRRQISAPAPAGSSESAPTSAGCGGAGFT